MAQRRGMFHMNSLTYHLDARQWLPADRIMQDEASKPIDLRPAVCGVVNTIRSDCFNNASKPSGNAIKKRYKKYFLGSEKNDQSLVEDADRTMMELIAYRERYLTPPELVKEIRTLYFPSSPSALHTPEGIVKRYRNLEQRDADKWTEADEWMEAFASQNANANTERFPIGVVVEHIKNEFFLTELSVTRTHIEDRYCRKFLRIESNNRNKARYDMIRVAEAMSMPLRTLSQKNASSTTISTDAKSDVSRPSFHESLPERPKKSLDQSSMKIAEPEPKPYIFPTRLFSKIQTPEDNRLTTLKRMRPDSLTSASGFAAYKPSVSDIPKISTAAQEEIYRDALRRSGFWSASNASTEDQNSTIARMSRGDVEFRACPLDHTILNPGSSCVLCSYPEVQPKPVVFLAPEFETAPYTDFTKSKILDEGDDDELYAVSDPTAVSLNKEVQPILSIPPHKIILDGDNPVYISQQDTIPIPQIDIVDVDLDLPQFHNLDADDTDNVNFMFLAEEFIGPRADIVDADDMDNGMLTLNANIRSWA